MLVSIPGKRTLSSSTHEKVIAMDCKLSEKNLDKMLTDGNVDVDLGMNVPLAVGGMAVKTEEVDEDVQKTKDMLADLKLTYQENTQ